TVGTLFEVRVAPILHAARFQLAALLICVVTNVVLKKCKYHNPSFLSFKSGGGTFAPPLVGATRFTSENGGITANRLPSTTRFRSENHNQGYTATGYAGSSAPAESLAYRAPRNLIFFLTAAFGIACKDGLLNLCGVHVLVALIVFLRRGGEHLTQPSQRFLVRQQLQTIGFLTVMRSLNRQ